MKLITEDKFGYPVSSDSKITSKFGSRVLYGKRHNHTGIDFGVKSNTEIKSPLNGVVVRSADGVGKCGGAIEIEHYLNNKKITTLYCHLNKRNVNVGDEVNKGDIIGYSGGETTAPESKKGRSIGPHLHFAVSEVDGGIKKKVDPMLYLDKDYDVATMSGKKLDKLKDIEIDGKKLGDILNDKEKIKDLSGKVIDNILKFIGLKESIDDKTLLEQRIIKRLKKETFY